MLNSHDIIDTKDTTPVVYGAAHPMPADLTADEAARKPWPATPEEAQRWEFNPAAQTWTRR